MRVSAEGGDSLRQRLAHAVGSAASFRRQLVRGGIGTLGAQVGAKVLMLATSVVLARVLGASGYGAYAFAMAVVGILAIPVELGLPRLLVREVAVYRRRDHLPLLKGLLLRANQVVLSLAIGIGLVAGICLYVLDLGPLAASTSTLLWALASLPLIGLSSVRAAALRGLGWVASGQLIQAVLRPGTYLLLIGVVACSLPSSAFTSITAIQIQIASLTVTLLFGYCLLAIALPAGTRFQRAEYDDRRWLASSLPFVLSAGAQVILQQTSTIMLGVLATPNDVGVYRVVSQGAMLVAFVHGAVSIVIEPHIARLADTALRDSLQRLVSVAAKASLVGAIPLAMLFIVFGHGILATVFGDEFAVGHEPLIILSIGQLINAATGSVGLILNMSGHAWYTMAGLAIAALTNILGCALLIPRFGMIGAAIASSISVIAWNVLLAYWAFKRTGLVTVRFRRRGE